MTSKKWRLSVHDTIHEIGSSVWDACANPDDKPYNPFLDFRFLAALEDSQSVCSDQGWAPQHISLQHNDQIDAVMPLYLKAHSQGEYIFDHGWADAFHRAGGQYYPKLLCAIPFTPASGRRLLVRQLTDGETEAAQKALLQGASELVEKLGLSSLHLNFLPENEWEMAGQYGYLQRTDQQFHWQNKNYQHFDDFLESLASRKRKNLKKERRKALENNIEIEWLTSDSLAPEHWDAFYEFYQDTGYRKWGQPYLTRDFFHHIHATMPEQTLLIMAKREGRYIAGALNFIGSDTLFGRHWGCVEDHAFLHFECCYYQAIDFAIAHGLAFVEAGAQGTHKLARGYEPVKTYSAHHIPHPNFRIAVENYLEQERRHVDNDMTYLAQYTPFKKNNEPDKAE